MHRLAAAALGGGGPTRTGSQLAAEAAVDSSRRRPTICRSSRRVAGGESERLVQVCRELQAFVRGADVQPEDGVAGEDARADARVALEAAEQLAERVLVGD